MTSRSRGPSDVNTKLTSLIAAYDTHLSGSGNGYDVWRPAGYYLTSTTTLTLINPIDTTIAIGLIAERYGGLISQYGSIWADVVVDVTIGGKSEDYDIDEVDLALLRGATAVTIHVSRSDVPPWEVYEFLGLPPMPEEQREVLTREADDVVRGWETNHYRILHGAILSRSFSNVHRAMLMLEMVERGYAVACGRAALEDGIAVMIRGAPTNPWRKG